LGFLGGASIAVGIAITYTIDRWLGFGITILALVLTPLVWAGMMALWPKTPVGKHLFLPPVQTTQGQQVALQLGQTGKAVSELRPTGECEFGDQRFEAISEHGLIHAGATVKIVGLSGTRPIVRAV
jgi:membrane-bound serine protease (ClpP class)